MIYRMDSFIENSINPITNYEYDASWVVLILTEREEYRQLVGSKNGCAYTVKISRSKCENWMLAIGDFISFCDACGKNVILVMSKMDYKTVQNYYNGHKYNEPFLREDEPTVLVHSTSMNSWEQIKKDGMLKSWNRLKAEKAIEEEYPIGVKLGDPSDISDYIMLGSGVDGEIVVNSKQKGRITTDVDSVYLTGARLYFDAGKIAKDGLLVRDGSHLKVKDVLPLEPYLIWVATWDVIGLESQTSTPKIFAEQSDKQFQKVYKQ